MGFSDVDSVIWSLWRGELATGTRALEDQGRTGWTGLRYRYDIKFNMSPTSLAVVRATCPMSMLY